ASPLGWHPDAPQTVGSVRRAVASNLSALPERCRSADHARRWDGEHEGEHALAEAPVGVAVGSDPGGPDLRDIEYLLIAPAGKLHPEALPHGAVDAVAAAQEVDVYGCFPTLRPQYGADSVCDFEADQLRVPFDRDAGFLQR